MGAPLFRVLCGTVVGEQKHPLYGWIPWESARIQFWVRLHSALEVGRYPSFVLLAQPVNGEVVPVFRISQWPIKFMTANWTGAVSSTNWNFPCHKSALLFFTAYARASRVHTASRDRCIVRIACHPHSRSLRKQRILRSRQR